MAKTFFAAIIGSIFFSMVIPVWAQIDFSVLEPYRNQRGPAGGDTGTREPSVRDLRYERENRAYALSQEGKWNDALPLYQELTRTRGSADDYFNLGAVLVNLKRYGEAEHAYNQIGFSSRNLKIDGLHSLHWAKGRALLGRGPYADAEKEFREVIRLKPDDAGAWNNLGVALMAQGKLVEAEDAFRRAYSLNPAEDIKGNIAKILAAQEAARDKEARLRMDRESQAGKDAVQRAFQETRNNLRSAMHTDTSVVDARVIPWGSELLRQVPELERSPAADRIRKGYQAVITHDWPVALAWWQEALQRDPDNKALQRSVDLAQWMVDWRKQTANRPATPFDAALAAVKRGDDATALRLIEQTARQHPELAGNATIMTTIIRQYNAGRAEARAHRTDTSDIIGAFQDSLAEELFFQGLIESTLGNEERARELGRASARRVLSSVDNATAGSGTPSPESTPTSPPREQTRLDFIP